MISSKETHFVHEWLFSLLFAHNLSCLQRGLLEDWRVSAFYQKAAMGHLIQISLSLSLGLIDIHKRQPDALLCISQIEVEENQPASHADSFPFRAWRL